VWVGSGSRRLFARAEFTDGSSIDWGPTAATLVDTLTWKLN
jgi:hypothetical protein